MRANQQHTDASAVLQPKTILVESLGMQHWLNMALAEYSGIAMNLSFPMPTRFMWQVSRDVLGESLIPKQSTYKREVLVWRLMSIVTDLQNDTSEIYQPLNDYLVSLRQQYTDAQFPAALFTFCRSIADTFEQYMLYRPDWLSQWELGQNVSELSNDRNQVWQASLWRCLIEQEAWHPANLHRKAISQLGQLTSLQRDALPDHVYVFALNTMAPQLVEFFDALASVVDVHIFHLNPCIDYWGDIRSQKQQLRSSQLAVWNTENSANALLANLGQQGRDLFNLLQQRETFEISAFEAPVPKEVEQNSERNSSLLATIQQSIFDGTPLPPLTDTHNFDTSVRVTRAHSPLRELQALHDYLLAQFEADPNLKPHEVLVMCPAIEDYAPFVSAVFDTSGKGRHGLKLPCSVADRAPVDSVPEVAAFLSLLTLPDSRFEVSVIIEYLRLDGIREHYNVSLSELNVMVNWLEKAHIHWGLSGQHQRHILQAQSGDNDIDAVSSDRFSWEWGLRRLLIGLAHTDHPVFDGQILTVPNAEGQQTETLGKLCWLIEQLQSHRQQLLRERTLPQWQVYLHQLKLDFFGDMAQTPIVASKIDRAIADLVTHGEMADFNAPVALSIVREALSSSFTAPDAVNNFMTGQVTLCSMLPMRSVPFKVIALLGLNDGEFPRTSQAMSIDLMQHTARRLGDRSRRGDDRYLFLEAIVSARQSLYCSYQAFQIRDNSERQPSLILREFVDFLAPSNGVALPFQTIDLPLHPFSQAHYDSEVPLLHSFDPQWLKVAQRIQHQPSTDEADTFNVQLPPFEIDAALSIRDLAGALANPLRAFAKQRLGIALESYAITLEDEEPFDMAGLSRFQILDELLSSDPEDGDVDRQCQMLLQSGAIPTGDVATETLTQWIEAVDGFKRIIADYQCQEVPLDIDINGIRIIDTVEQAGNAESDLSILLRRIGKPKAAHIVEHRLRQMVIACQTDRPIEAECLYLFPDKQQMKVRVLPYDAVSPDEAQATLSAAIQAYEQILQMPSVMHAEIGEALISEFSPEALATDEQGVYEKVEKLLSTNFSEFALGNDPYLTWFFPKGDVAEYINTETIEALYRRMFTGIKSSKGIGI